MPGNVDFALVSYMRLFIVVLIPNDVIIAL
jgi:hypothetical protein